MRSAKKTWLFYNQLTTRTQNETIKNSSFISYEQNVDDNYFQLIVSIVQQASYSMLISDLIDVWLGFCSFEVVLFEVRCVFLYSPEIRECQYLQETFTLPSVHIPTILSLLSFKSLQIEFQRCSIKTRSNVNQKNHKFLISFLNSMCYLRQTIS